MHEESGAVAGSGAPSDLSFWDPPPPPPPPETPIWYPGEQQRRDRIAQKEWWAKHRWVAIAILVTAAVLAVAGLAGAVYAIADDSEQVEQLETEVDDLAQSRLALEADIAALEDDVDEARAALPEARESGYDNGYLDGHRDGYLTGYDIGWKDGLDPIEPYSPDTNVTGVPGA